MKSLKITNFHVFAYIESFPSFLIDVLDFTDIVSFTFSLNANAFAFILSFFIFFFNFQTNKQINKSKANELY